MRTNRAASLVLAAGFAMAVAGCQKEGTDGPTIEPGASTSGPADTSEPSAPPAPVLDRALEAVPAWVDALQPASGVQCYADKVNDQGGAGEGDQQRTFKTGTPFVLMGWSVDTSLPAGAAQPEIMVVLKGTSAKYAFKAARHDRPDVSAAPEFSGKAPKSVGVMLNATLQGVSPGPYRVQYILGEGASAKLCELGAPWHIAVTQ